MVLPLTVNESAEKSGLPKMAAINGVRMLLTNEVTTAPKAAPITTATAKSMTLPRKRNFLKPASMVPTPPSLKYCIRDGCVTAAKGGELDIKTGPTVSCRPRENSKDRLE